MKDIEEFVSGLSERDIQSRIEKITNLCNRLSPNEDSFMRVDRRFTVSLKGYCKILELELSRRK
jgi:hypothetical protein